MAACSRMGSSFAWAVPLAWALLAMRGAPAAAATPRRNDAAVPDTVMRDPSPRTIARIAWIVFGGNYWDDVSRLTPDRREFSPPFDGTMRHLGFDLEVGGMGAWRRFGPARVLFGGEFGAQTNDSDRRYVGTYFGTGAPVRARMYANSGYFVLNGALVFRESTSLPLHLGVGFGPYLLAIKDVIEGMVVETNHRDTTLGSYVALGLDRRFGASRAAWRLEARAHFFGFDAIGPAYVGQAARGPMFTIATGMAWIP